MPVSTFSILGDSPVGADRDKLQFGAFVNPFAERLIGSVANTPFTVGIFADWGQGKSTVMQMLRNVVEDKGCPTVWFEPWKHNTREAVWKGLALTLVMEIRREAREHPSLWKEIRRKQGGLKRFGAKALWGTLVGREWAQELVDAIEKEPWSPTLLHEFEENLDTLFALIRSNNRTPESMRPLILFVDDLDRCLPDAALAVLEALKLVFNRPGLITIMGIAEAELGRSVLAAYGKEMREAQLELDASWGQKYIKKIIQMPFPLPVISEKSFDNYIDTCLADSGVGTVLGKDTTRWLEVIREACESNLREVKRFINNFISEFDKAYANGPQNQNQQTLDPPRVAFVLLLAWRFLDFLVYIRKQAGERDLLVRYQIFFAQKTTGNNPDSSLLPDGEEKFRENLLLQSFFNRCFTGEAPLVLPFTDWNDIEPYLQFGLRSPRNPVTAAGGGASIPNAANAAPTMQRPAAAASPAPPTPSSPSAAATAPSEAAKETAARVQSLMSSGRLEEALSSAMSAITLVAASNDRGGESTLWDLIGSIYQAQGKRDEANAAYEKALVIARGAGLKRESIGIFLNLARLHLSEDPRRALESATEGLKVAREIGDALSEANAYVDLADAHKELENVNDAAASYESALGIYQRLSSVQGELLTLGRLSLLYSESDVERARQFNESGIALAERLGDKNALLRLLANRAHMEQTAGLSPDAVSGYYERAISLATELENKDEIRDLQEELAQFKSDQAFSMTLDHDIQVSPPVSFKPKPRSKSAGRRLK